MEIKQLSALLECKRLFQYYMGALLGLVTNYLDLKRTEENSGSDLD